ncbi:PucR family transcriptional regulator [Streptomyces sp. NPDC059785]|uniref:PucR family transcriptional regulator n=1 Tax=unclassified Streptomyces TaxID=2593676 RepID=UPI00365FD4BD
MPEEGGEHVAEREPEPEQDYLLGYARILAEVSATGRRPTRAELDARRALGERAADDGRDLRDLVRRHLEETRLSWPGTPGTADSVLFAVELAVDAFTEGYERAQRLAVRQEEAARREFIDDLLYGRSDLGRLAERAERFGLVLSGSHAVAVAGAPTAYADTDPLTRRVEAALNARFGERNVLLTTKNGQLICIAPGDHDEVLGYFAQQACAAADGSRVAVGRAQPGPGGVVHSYEEALSTLDLADRLELEGSVVHAADLLVYPVLARDRQALADLVLSALSPLRQARGGAEPLLRTLETYFETGCSAAGAARRLALSVRALTYRLERIHQLTGANPADPLHRYTLQTAVIGARLLDWPAQEL